MNAQEYKSHLIAGRLAGEEKTCGSKIRYQGEKDATKAANHMNYSGNGRHPLEPYPCCWCLGWHIGRRMDEIK